MNRLGYTLLALLSFSAAHASQTCIRQLMSAFTSPQDNPVAIVAGAADFTTARVIAIGDHHGTPAHTKGAAAAINAYGTKGDLVLIEGLSANKTVDRASVVATADIRKDVVVMGWDDIAAVDASFVLLKRFLELSKVAADSFEIRQVEKQLNDLTQRRNLSLGKTLVTAMKEEPKRRIWILGGAAHFSPDHSPLSFALDRSNTKYVILNPKGVLPDASDAELEAHFLKNMDAKAKGFTDH